MAGPNIAHVIQYLRLKRPYNLAMDTISCFICNCDISNVYSYLPKPVFVVQHQPISRNKDKILQCIDETIFVLRIDAHWKYFEGGSYSNSVLSLYPFIVYTDVCSVAALAYR